MAFTSPVRRVAAPGVAGEREALTRWLDWHRATLLSKLDGLGEEDLRRVVLPSGLSLLGLVKHLTDVERGWFAIAFAGAEERRAYQGDGAPDAAFRVEDRDRSESVVAAYLAHCE